jgi:hypothetical protein
VHAEDSLSIIENLPGLSATVASAKAISGGKPIVVSPVTLRPRFIPSFWEGESTDPRQSERFCAAWSLMAVRHLSEAGAEAATFFELGGPQGLFSLETAGCVPYPVYHVFQELSAWRQAELLEVESGDPLRIDGFALQKGHRSVLMLCNMTAEPQEALVEGEAPKLLQWEWLVPWQEVGAFMTGHMLTIPPYSIGVAKLVDS